MCGRFSLTLSSSNIESIIQDVFQESLMSKKVVHQPRFNIAPSQHVWAIIHDGVHYRIGNLSWGLIPSFATDAKIGFQMINAKTETVFEKPSFSNSIFTSRCLILADGYYEWQDRFGIKIPHYISLKDESLFAFAGLYAKNNKLQQQAIFSTAILTRHSEGVLASIHDRAPIILKKADWKAYLNPNLSHDQIKPLFAHLPTQLFSLKPVSTYVNKPTNEGPSCLHDYEPTSLF
jgi:putative SOS response-associated peptidase YedK